MFGIGMPEMILILAVALIVIGPKKLPDLAKSLGRAIGEFKRATNDFKSSLDIDDSIVDVKNSFDEVNQDVKNIVDFNVKDAILSPSESGDTSDSNKDNLEVKSKDVFDAGEENLEEKSHDASDSDEENLKDKPTNQDTNKGNQDG